MRIPKGKKGDAKMSKHFQEKVKKHKNTLINTLKKSEIATIGELKILGYDAPFKFYNRRNEVMIEINYNN